MDIKEYSIILAFLVLWILKGPTCHIIYLPPLCLLAAAIAAAVNPVSPGVAVEFVPMDCLLSLW